MSAGARIAAFAAMLAAIFAAAAVAGAKLDPSISSSGEHQGDEDMNGHATTAETPGEHAEAGHEPKLGEAMLPGLAVAQAGYQLVPQQTELPSAPDAGYRFRIVGADGETVQDFDTEHERRMHLIVVRRDFHNFQHLHPEQLADGSWAAEADLDQAGVYRVFADFAAEGQSLTLASDLFVAGAFEPKPLAAPLSTAAASDGYEVTLDSAAPRAGAATQARFSISRAGEALDSVEPYLGADGHLVALREHDQAFLHTHPEGEPGGPGPISFQVHYPTAGRYRLFLQFKHRGEVRTAAFTQEAIGTGAKADAGTQTDDHDEVGEADHGH